MALTPIDMMIDRADLRCTRCNEPRSKGCDCWREITLRCPQCKRTKQAVNDPTDPKGTEIVEVLCDKCDRGDGFPETHYYDAKGRWFDGKKFKRVR